MRTQPNCGLRCFISTMAAISCAEGPFGPGFRLRHEEENSRRYFRWTNALWNLNSVAGLRLADSFGVGWGLTKGVVSPTQRRRGGGSFGQSRARRRDGGRGGPRGAPARGASAPAAVTAQAAPHVRM